MNATITPAYVPGVCNINREEIAYRRKAGYLGLTIFVILLVALLLLPLSRYFRIILVGPAILGASGFLQARNKFCVAYGAAGKQNADEGSASASEIADAAARKMDKQKTRRINMQTFAIAIVVTLISIVAPHIG